MNLVFNLIFLIFNVIIFLKYFLLGLQLFLSLLSYSNILFNVFIIRLNNFGNS